MFGKLPPSSIGYRFVLINRRSLHQFMYSERKFASQVSLLKHFDFRKLDLSYCVEVESEVKAPCRRNLMSIKKLRLFCEEWQTIQISKILYILREKRFFSRNYKKRDLLITNLSIEIIKI